MPTPENGGLVVAVTHSKRTYPVESAVVTLFDKYGKLVTTAVTDQSGKTPRIELTTPSADLSQTPQSTPSLTASYYTVKIDAPLFLKEIINNVPVYSGITSLQSVDLTFRSAMPNGNITDTTNLDYPDL